MNDENRTDLPEGSAAHEALADEKARSRYRRDLHDLNAESAGLETGKIRRFITSRDDPRHPGFRAARDRRDQLLALQQVMGPEYASRFQRLTDRLAELEVASAKALLEAERRVQAAEETLRTIRESAAIAPDGRRVYRTQDGKRAFHDDGTEVSQETMQRTEWTPSMPTWEARTHAGENKERALTERDQVADYHKQVTDIQTGITAGNLPSIADIDEIEANLERTMPNAVRAQTVEPAIRTSAAREYAVGGKTKPTVPDAAAAFNAARIGGPMPEPVNVTSQPASKPEI